jgi:hypothetical protein
MCESTLRLSTRAQSWRNTAVASHISRKTSEIWGPQDSRLRQ